MARSRKRDSMDNLERVHEILAIVKPLAVEYYQLTGRPLGVTGEFAEYVAAEHLGLTLAPQRTAGYSALRGDERILIRGRALASRIARWLRICAALRFSLGCDLS